MVEFDAFKLGFASQIPKIRNIQALCLSELSLEELPKVSAEIWQIISGLAVGIGETKIVSGSKALHHVLPELVPPIDRQYTARFFFHHKTFNQGDRTAFFEMFPSFHRIFCDGADQFSRLIGKGWMSTSTTKLIDNAIVGWVVKHSGVKEPDSGASERHLARRRL
jgi:hypothetical protein